LYLATVAYAALGVLLAVLALFVPGPGPAFAFWTLSVLLLWGSMALRKRSLALGGLPILAWLVRGAGSVRAWTRGRRAGPTAPPARAGRALVRRPRRRAPGRLAQSHSPVAGRRARSVEGLRRVERRGRVVRARRLRGEQAAALGEEAGRARAGGARSRRSRGR